MAPEYDKSIEFLKRWAPDGPWVVTAIEPDKKGMETRTFRPSTERLLREWLDRNGASRNIYFHVNPTTRDLDKKADREDIAALAWLHVDIDPRAGEDLAKERERALKALQNPPGGLPPPTVIVFSGGGYQGFWKLEKPVPINGDLPTAEDAKRWNLQLEILYQADHCHNVDRIMRLPGTVNRPDQKKVKKGRTPALAELVEWHDDRVYPIEKFTKAPLASGSGSPGWTIPLKRLSSVEELPDTVPLKIKEIILHGHDPADPNRLPSRSEWQHYACMELVRAGVGDEVIHSIITTPAFGVSASVLDKGRNAESYARRQVDRARDFAENDAVAVVNRSYFAALEGGRVTYYREEPGGALAAMNAEAFEFELASHTAMIDDGKGGQRAVSASKLWKTSPRRRYYPRGFVLDPRHGEAEGEYNLWKGFGTQPALGDWSLMRAHVHDVLAAGNSAHADYILRWAAWSVQNPATPPRVALVFRGDEGVGKGVFCNALVQIFGHHGQRAQSMLQVAGRFNAHMRHCCFLFADEVSLIGDDQEGTLKGMITERTLPIEGKGKDLIQAENHLHVVMASNRDWVVPAGIGARRFAMFDVPAVRKGDRSYFDQLWGQLRGGGLAAMLHDLLQMELGSWHPEAARPNTDALTDQKMRTLPPLPRVFLDALMSGMAPCGQPLGKGLLMPTRPLAEAARDRAGREDVSDNDVQIFLGRKLGFAKNMKTRPRGWEVPSLAAARSAWDKSMFPVPWDDTSEWCIEGGI